MTALITDVVMSAVLFVHVSSR